jgi:hypothetical protein
MPCAFTFAFESAGRSIAAKMAMIAITTSSSIKVKPVLDRLAEGVFFMSLDVRSLLVVVLMMQGLTSQFEMTFQDTQPRWLRGRATILDSGRR